VLLLLYALASLWAKHWKVPCYLHVRLPFSLSILVIPGVWDSAVSSQVGSEALAKVTFCVLWLLNLASDEQEFVSFVD